MTKKYDNEAVFSIFRRGAEALRAGVTKGANKVEEVLDANPRAKAMRDKVGHFAQEKLEKAMDLRIGKTRVGDLGYVMQSLSERQLYKLISRLQQVDPHFDWQQFVPAQGELPVFAAFESLDLPYGTPFVEVKKQYRKLLRSIHPDKHAENPETERVATEKTQAITAAYELISRHYGK